MTSLPAPGPWIVRFLVRSSSPLLSVIVGVGGGAGGGGGVGFLCPCFNELDFAVERDSVAALDSVEEKTMVSPLWAAVISARREPGPLSLVLVTVSVLK